ncbi:hypothetical protein Tco_0894299 [Tanacetum coccineum]|uniref:Uncharacterized protein n=1 Tax=Tanacetum coccineum TaxID=301880 RepID=A0ABQ5CE60_9ASTR
MTHQSFWIMAEGWVMEPKLVADCGSGWACSGWVVADGSGRDNKNGFRDDIRRVIKKGVIWHEGGFNRANMGKTMFPSKDIFEDQTSSDTMWRILMILQHDCTDPMLLTYHIKYPFTVGLKFAFVTTVISCISIGHRGRGGRFDESNAETSHGRRCSNFIIQVPRDPSKRTMINLDGGGFTATTISSYVLGLILKARDKSIKMAKLAGVEFDGSDFSVLETYNPEWIESSYWEDTIDRVCNTKSKL